MHCMLNCAKVGLLLPGTRLHRTCFTCSQLNACCDNPSHGKPTVLPPSGSGASHPSLHIQPPCASSLALKPCTQALHSSLALKPCTQALRSSLAKLYWQSLTGKAQLATPGWQPPTGNACLCGEMLPAKTAVQEVPLLQIPSRRGSSVL